MHFDVLYRPAHTMAVAHLAAGESVRAESGAMVSMSANVQVETAGLMNKKSGGLFKNLKRMMLSGESFFTNTFTVPSGQGHVTLAPSLCGDMIVHDLAAPRDLFIQGSSYVAAPDSVQIDTKFQGFWKGIAGGENLFFLHATGRGPVLVNAFGAIETIDLDGELIVDSGHLVAFEGSLQYEISRPSRGLFRFFFSGEGFVMHFRGRGRLYVQTRKPAEFGGFVGRLLPPRKE